MFFILSKTAYILLMPFTWIVGFFILAYLARKNTHGKKLLRMGLILLLFFSNEFIINELNLLWDYPALPLSEINEPYEAAIVLTGVTSPGRPPTDRVHLQRGADRIMHAVQLYKERKVKRIIVTGGSGRLTGEKFSEAGDIVRVLLLAGVAQKDILYEEASRNTRENALFTKELIIKAGLENKRFLLVTSAFHMRRAKGCFEKEGLHCTPFSVDFSGDALYRFEFSKFFVPNVSALGRWEKFAHELLGFITYKVMGYA